MVFAAATMAESAAINVLVVGSSKVFNGQEDADSAKGKLDVTEIASSLEQIINYGHKRSAGPTVSFEDVYRTKMVDVAGGSGGRITQAEFHCHSLVQYYFWPEGRQQRLDNLCNRGTTQWDHIILVGDPYIISEMPGVYAEGVRLLAEKIREGEAEIVLIAPWLADEEKTKLISEVVHRVGQALEIPVAAAADAWLKLSNRRSLNGGYLAAAGVVSALSGQRAWSPSFREERLAREILTAVQRNKGSQPFSTKFSVPNPFAMKYVDKQQITFHQTGTSSERGIKHALVDALKRCGIQAKEIPDRELAKSTAKVDFNYGRGNSNFEPQKRYQVAPEQFGRSYGFPMQEAKQSAAVSMLYGIDKRYYNGSQYDDGTDLGIAYDMIREDEVKADVRTIPIRLLWAKLKDANPELQPLRDKWHMHKALDAASGAFLVTLLTGQNPVGEEPAEKQSAQWNLWLGRKIGYQTAMVLGQLSFAPATQDTTVTH